MTGRIWYDVREKCIQTVDREILWESHLEELCTDESITLRWLSRNEITGVDWLRPGTSGRLF